ncbi:MAG: ABC transporter substrate-binding protein [Alphaproteobacteria bacterium]|nr:ABC transporter substrate-binding protein [Alphaproteobacteria bacterium]
MKKIYLWVLFFLGVATIANAAIDKEKALSMVENLTKKGIEEIVNSDASVSEKNEVFRKLFDENLDIDFISRYVLGRYWRKASVAQRVEFVFLYKEYNVKTWSKRFDEFKGKKFIFKDVIIGSNPNQAFVKTEVPMDDGKPATVRWRVSDKDGVLKIIDIIIENVSLVQTARNEYTSFIAKSPKGVDSLLENLREKIK